jgi:autotransporter-associated beta strand protein
MRESIFIRGALIGLAVPMCASAALYWDLNDIAPGAGTTPIGTWDLAGFNWNPNPAGTDPVGTWVAGETAVFSAGTDATDPYTVNVSGTQTAAGLVIEEGAVTLSGGAVAIGGGTVVVGPGASLITNSSLRISAATGAGAVYTVNGGTLETTNTGNAGSFIDIDATITLGPGGGTFVYNVAAPTLNIIQTTTIISGPGSFTKEGQGVIALASPSTYTGATIINNGELRVRQTVGTDGNRLPITTPVTVTSPGILNLNSVNQQIGSLTGNGAVGLGNATLTVGDATDTTFSGEIANVRTAGGGVTTGNGKLTKVGTGTLTLSGLNSYTGTFTLMSGTVTVTPTGMLADSICDVVVNGGTLNLNNPVQTIENLSGAGGIINLGAGHTFTVNSVANSTFSGVIAGPGAFTKSSTFTQTLAGASTYTGATTISAGTLEVSGSITGTSKVDVAGTIAGSGTIAPAISGNVNIMAGGKLSPGGGLGTLTVALNGGAMDISPAITLANSLALIFDLDLPASSDKLRITGGALNIGTGVLEFDDFMFSTLAGFVPEADYVLFDGSLPLLGTLGANRFGLVNGFSAELLLADGGNDIVLHVIPEPSAALALLAGSLSLVGLRRRPKAQAVRMDR